MTNIRAARKSGNRRRRSINHDYILGTGILEFLLRNNVYATVIGIDPIDNRISKVIVVFNNSGRIEIGAATGSTSHFSIP
jgi:hypothetical protein